MATEIVVGKMSDGGEGGDSFFSSLFSLINNILPRPFTELELISFTMEKEKELLNSLSQIFNLIRRWTDEQQQDTSRSSDSQSSDSCCGDDEILTKIVANLVSLLNARSQYVRHMVGNIFLVFSEFLLPYGNSWDRFIRLLCVCFELAMSNIVQHWPQSLTTDADNSKSVVSNMKSVLNNSTWNGVAEILRILRGVVKHLKGTDDDELMKLFSNSLSNCLTNVPWDLLNVIHHDSTHSKTKVGGSYGEAAEKILFLGNFVQLLCSVVDLIGSTDGADSHYKSAILYEINDLVPRLLMWCHVEEWSHIFPYFRHKILDLLSSPISQFACGQSDTLEGSPFLLSLGDQEDDMLFEVLLQMFTIPSWAERLFSNEGRACHVTEEDILFHVSNLFNPLLLFHVFLAELQYDHQLLLDYLISKDMGGKCAEYLLRQVCLRIVCDSWELFLKYSVREGLVYQSICRRGCKKRRASPDDSSVGQIDTPLESGLAFELNQLECNLGRIESLQFEDAKGCLLSLKSALRKLHRRKLFPYNPEVLMRRLTRFEELCDRLV
uniref:Uncharacterized protein n=1 Tax=Chenopodium quinoa TaxID=63459 RepID=A0A803KSG6_CHEQI